MSLKLFGKNSIIYAFGNIALRLSSFLLIPLYTNYLSISEYGMLATLLLTTQFLMKLINFGLLNSLMRFMADYRESRQVGKFLGSAMLLNLASGAVISLIAGLVLAPVFKIVFHATEVSNYVLLTTLAAYAQSLCINMMSYYRANNRGAAFSILSILIALLIIGGNVFIVAYTDLRIYGVMLVQISSYGLFWILISLKIFSQERFGISGEIFVKLFRFGYPLIFGNIGGLVVNTSSVYFLGYFTNLETVAIYSLALKIAQISSMVLVLPFQYAYEPFVYSNINSPDLKSHISKLTTLLIFSFYFVSVAIVIAFRDLIKLMGPPDYYLAYNYLYLLLPAIAFTGLSYIGQSLLHIESKTKTSGFTIGAISTLSVLFNYILIQIIGLNGVVMTYNFKLISVGILMMYLGKKTFPIDLEWPRLLTLAGWYVITFTTVFYLHDQSAVLFYPFMAIFTILTGCYFYFSNFFTLSEKASINSFFGKKFKSSKIPGTVHGKVPVSDL